MSAAWASFAGLCSLGLLLIASLSFVTLRACRRAPVLGYRIHVALLFAALLLPPMQWLVQGRAHVATRSRAALPAPIVAPGVEVLRSALEPSAFAVDAAPSVVPALPPPPSVPDAALAPEPAGLPWLAIYSLGVAAVLLACVVRMLRTRRLLARAFEVDREDLLQRHPQLDLRGLEAVRLLSSERLATPCCAGLRHPAIVLPARLLFDDAAPADLEFAIAHERVHLERHDPRTQLVQRVFTALFWFHPAAWWLSRQIDLLREYSCDELVVARTGQCKSYASALLQFAESASIARGQALLPMSNRSLLRRRIEMLSLRRNPLPKNRRLTFASIGGVAIVALCLGQLTVASAFPGDGLREWKVARCDEKKKAKVQPAAPCCPPQTPPRTDMQRPPQSKPPAKDGKIDVTREGSRRNLFDSRELADFLARKQASGMSMPVSFVSGTMLPASPPAPMDEEIREVLIQTLLRDDDNALRVTAAAALAPQLNDERVKQAFIEALRDSGDSSLRVTVLGALLRRESISPDTKELLVRLFSMDGEEMNRISAAEALSPYADEPDARDTLIAALLDDRNDMVQLNAARALASYTSDSKVREAMVSALYSSHNEVARMAMIEGLGTQVGEADDVRSLFLTLLIRDDNPVARMAIAKATAAHADDADVRQLMYQALVSDVSDVIEMTFADALAPLADQPDVKRAFIDSLPHLDNDVVRMRVITALAGALHGERDPNLPGVPTTGFGLDPNATGSFVPVSDAVRR